MTKYLRLDQVQQFQAIKIVSDGGASPGKVVIPQAAQVMPVFSLTDGNTARIVMYGRYSGAFDVTQAELDAASAAFHSGASWSTLSAFLAPSFSYVGINVRDVNQIDQPILAAGGAAPGTSAGTALPDEVALACTFLTPRAGKSGRGRGYMPGWATNALGTGGVVAAPAVAALQGWFEANIPLVFSALGMTHVLGLKARIQYTGSTGTLHPARPATTLDVNGYVVRDNHWDSQRRRGLR